jgi:hypothetical protein
MQEAVTGKPMKRYNYKVNGLFHTVPYVGDLTPSFFYEVSPGETWSGNIDIDAISPPTQGLTLNRMYLDHFVYFVPYRVIWDAWPAFISQRQVGTNRDPDVTVPTQPPMMYGATPTDIDEALGVALGKFWIKQKLYEDPSSAGDYGFNALPIWAYYHIWNSFFRPPPVDPVDYPTGTISSLLKTYYRQNEFFVRAGVQESPADVVPDTSTVDNLRGSFARDQFNKVRDYFGDSYADYLSSVGVSVPWSMTDTAEELGRKSFEMKYHRISNTAETGTDPLGLKSGFFTAKYNAGIRKFFAPEHGIIMGVYALRPEAPRASYSHPSYAKGSDKYSADDPNMDWWSPEYDSKKQVNMLGSLFQENSTSAFPTTDLEVPIYNDLKSGVNLTSAVMTNDDQIYNYYFNRLSIANGTSEADSIIDMILPDQSSFTNMFDSNEGVQASVGSVAKTILSKNSPIEKYFKPIY